MNSQSSAGSCNIKWIRWWLCSSSLFLAAVAVTAQLGVGQQPGVLSKSLPTAAEKFTHVTELGTMPAEQMGKVMNLMSEALGVSCQHCHAGNDFAAENVGGKDVAREMIAMTFKLNKDYFQGRTSITCYTCHRGETHPVAVSFGKPGLSETSLPVTAALPHVTVDAVLDKFVQAVGGADKLSAIQSRYITAKRIEPSGRFEPEELWQTANGRSHLTTLYGNLPIVEVFDGRSAWKLAGDNDIPLKFDELAQIEMEATVAQPLSIKHRLPGLRVQASARIDERETHVLAVDRYETLTERFYFDAQSGLLVRRTSSLPTVLGEFVYQVDYTDYREYEGVKLPATLRFQMPNVRWDRSVMTVENNVAIDENLFRKNN
jgi:hypothetical protein